MESKRILLSDKHLHDVRLSERQMAIIQHALSVLAVAFSLEPEYLALIIEARITVIRAVETPVIEGE